MTTPRDLSRIPLSQMEPPTPQEDVLMRLREALASLTVTLVCHPDDEERVRTAASDLRNAPPLRVITSTGLRPGQLVHWTGDQLRSWAP